MVIDAELRFAIPIHNDDWGGPGALRRLDDLLFQPLINLSIYDCHLLARGPIHWQGYGVSSWYHIDFHFPCGVPQPVIKAKCTLVFPDQLLDSTLDLWRSFWGDVQDSSQVGRGKHLRFRHFSHFRSNQFLFLFPTEGGLHLSPVLGQLVYESSHLLGFSLLSSRGLI